MESNQCDLCEQYPTSSRMTQLLWEVYEDDHKALQHSYSIAVQYAAASLQ